MYDLHLRTELKIDSLTPIHGAHRAKLQTLRWARQTLRQERLVLVQGEAFSLSEVFSLLAYFKATSLTASGWGKGWFEDEPCEILNFKRHLLTMQSIKTYVQDLVSRLHISHKTLFLNTPIPHVDLKSIHDDLSNLTSGYSFLDDCRNHIDKLHIIRHVDWSYLFLPKRSYDLTYSIRSSTLQYLLLHHTEFFNLLLLAIHWTSGQPPRGTAELNYVIINLIHQPRNIYISNGLVMFISRYHKCQEQSGVPRPVARFLTPLLSSLLVTYLSYVRPFLTYLRHKTVLRPPSAYLFEDRGSRISSPQLSKALKHDNAEG